MSIRKHRLRLKRISKQQRKCIRLVGGDRYGIVGSWALERTWTRFLRAKHNLQVLRRLKELEKSGR